MLTTAVAAPAADPLAFGGLLGAVDLSAVGRLGLVGNRLRSRLGDGFDLRAAALAGQPHRIEQLDEIVGKPACVQPRQHLGQWIGLWRGSARRLFHRVSGQRPGHRLDQLGLFFGRQAGPSDDQQHCVEQLVGGQPLGCCAADEIVDASFTSARAVRRIFGQVGSTTRSAGRSSAHGSGMSSRRQRRRNAGGNSRSPLLVKTTTELLALHPAARTG